MKDSKVPRSMPVDSRPDVSRDEVSRFDLSRRELLSGLTAVGTVTALGLPSRLLATAPKHATAKSAKAASEYPVNNFQGTGGHGHTFPGATVPFGMVQLSPDTFNDGWDWCSGYHDDDTSIMGFSHTHLSGTGCGDLLDFLIMPRIDEVRLMVGDRKEPGTGYRSIFDKKTESAKPGYYSVELSDVGKGAKIKAELTATEHVGLHRYTFPASDSAHVILDLTHVYGPDKNLAWSSIQVMAPDMLLLGRATNSWGPNREMYAAVQFSKPFDKVEVFDDGKPVATPTAEVKSKKLVAAIHFKTRAGEEVLIKSGLSGTGTDGAQKNLKAEIPAWDFAKVQADAASAWHMQLSKVEVETANRDQKTLFYTSLYHSMCGPTYFDDVDGLYRGMDGKNHHLEANQRNYTTFSCWDTYRAEHPLFTMIHADRVPDMVNSLIRMAEQSPAGMPVWPLQGTETGTMTGYHSASIMAEACAKNFSGIDWQRAYAVMHKRAFVDDYRGLGLYRKMGYIPCDLEEESVSKTLEYDYNDWAVAHVATKVGENADAEKLLQSSRNYRNLWDNSTAFLRPKFESGKWAIPFDPIDMGHWDKWRDYTESNAWQTAFAVQHDVTKYIELFGGDEAFLKKLDYLFSGPSTLPKDAVPDIAGLIGQYAHGNEPSHHIAYLYAFAGQPWKTQQRIHQIVTTLYSNHDDGMAGNEDVGQMSAWYMLSSIGFYSVDPVSAKYILGTPLFDKVTLNMADGKKLIVEAKRQTPDSIYIASVEFEGQPHPRSWFSHADIAHGGHFIYHLQSKPNEKFGAALEDRPKSELTIAKA